MLNFNRLHFSPLADKLFVAFKNPFITLTVNSFELKSILLISVVLLTCRLFFSPFPTVAESIQKELDEYRASEEEVKRLKNVMVCSLKHTVSSINKTTAGFRCHTIIKTIKQIKSRI